MLTPNHATCVRCPKRAPRCAGKCPCTLDNRDIVEHAKAGYCPEKRFGNGLIPSSWSLTEEVIAVMFERDKLGGCGCDPPGGE